MKKREAAIALSLLSLVSAACLKGMKAIGEKMEREKEKKLPLCAGNSLNNPD